MKTWMWITLAVIIILIIGYAVYASNKAREEQLKIQMQQQQLSQLGNQGPRTSKLAEILDSLVPFLVLV